jgi:multiple sugar transport system ATP-binding protein
MSVYDNIAFPLKIKKVAKDIIEEKVKKVAEIVGLSELLERKPKALSGGQRQRVALGRAIIKENVKVLLMDEPLSNLDAKLRVEMRSSIIKLHQDLGVTIIYVTHDQVEAMTMADRIVVMDKGIAQQIGTPKEIYDYPVNLFVAGFIGTPGMNFISGNSKDGYFIINENNKIKLDKNQDALVKKEGLYEKELVLGIRPEDINVSDEKKENSLEITVDIAELLGAEYYIHFYIGENKLTAKTKATKIISNGSKVFINFVQDKIHLFDKETTNRLK